MTVQFRYTTQLADHILHELSMGRPLRDVCRDPGMPAAHTVRNWAKSDKNGFAARYHRARSLGYPNVAGGTTRYTGELAARILRELASGRTLKDVCRDPGMPSDTTVRDWAAQDRKGFAARYSRAREIGWHAMADDTIDIADDKRNDWVVRAKPDGSSETVPDTEHIQRSRLRVNARQWMVSRSLPRIYGDQQSVSANDQAARNLTELMRIVDTSSPWHELPSEAAARKMIEKK